MDLRAISAFGTMCLLGAELSAGAIMAHIVLPKHPMPTIPLTQSELADLAAYILSMRKSG